MRQAPRILTSLAAALALTGTLLVSADAHADTSPPATATTAGRSLAQQAHPLIATGSATGSTDEHPATTANPYNPLADRHWGVYKGKADQQYTPFAHAKGTIKKKLATIALQPKATWFGRYIATKDLGHKVRKYIRQTLHGNKDALVQMTLFRVDPWEDAACHALPSKQQQDNYKAGVDKVAKAIGSTHVALILQPDGPFALCAPHHSLVYSHLIDYATRVLGGLPHTSVYIEAGAADYLHGSVAKALRILLPAGIAQARGFAFDSTHYDSTANQIRFGAKVVKALAARGIEHRHFVINTAENGRPFTGKYWNQHPSGTNFDNAGVCRKPTQRHCVTLGIPPTTDVANPAWGLTPTEESQAAAYVDAYLWIGRPWLYNQASPFVLKRALNLVATTPY